MDENKLIAIIMIAICTMFSLMTIAASITHSQRVKLQAQTEQLQKLEEQNSRLEKLLQEYNRIKGEKPKLQPIPEIVR